MSVGASLPICCLVEADLRPHSDDENRFRVQSLANLHSGGLCL